MRMMVRGGCLPLRRNTRMAWKHADEHCVCGRVESEEHVLFDCNRYIDMGRGWKGNRVSVNVDVYEML